MTTAVVLSDSDGSVSRTIAELCAERGLRPVAQLADRGDASVLIYLSSPRESVPWSQLNGVLVNRYRGNALLTRKSKLARLLRGYAQHPATFVLSPPVVLAPQAGACEKETPIRARIAEDKRQALALENESERQALRDADAAHPGYWIVKDAQGAKGANIHVCGSAQEAEAEVDSGRHSTLAVVQAYLSDPYLLPGGRKFDMRVWVLIDPAFRVYAHRLGVCRTSSVPYVRDDLSNTLSHITNHCIQEGAEHFGEHEPGNELFFDTFSALLKDAALSFEDGVWPQITAIISHVGAAACETMWNDPAALAEGSSARCYQLFGWDFLLDANCRVHLLEINGSPACAEALRETIVRDLVAILLDGQHASQETGFQLIWENKQGAIP